MSRAFIDKDFTNLAAFPELYALNKLDICEVGLIDLKLIKKKCPNLVYLDVSGNKIYSLEAIEALAELDDFVDINFSGNPICIHNHLKDEILENLPFIERINEEDVRDTGFKYK